MFEWVKYGEHEYKPLIKRNEMIKRCSILWSFTSMNTEKKWGKLNDGTSLIVFYRNAL